MSGEAQRGRAATLLDANRPAEAIRELATLLAHEPDDVEGLRLLARAQLEAGEPRDALTTVTRLLAFVPGDAPALLTASRIHTQLAEHGWALAAARAAIAAEPESADAHIALVEAVIASRTPTAEADASAAAAVRIAPWASAVHITQGNLLRLRKKRRAARAAYRRALAISPQSMAARNNLALLDLDNGFAIAAVRSFAGLLRQNPQYRIARQNLIASVAAAFRTIRIGLLVPWFLLLLLDTGLFGQDARTLFVGHLAVGLLSALVVVGYSALFVTLGGAGVRNYVVSQLRRNGLFVISVALLAASVAFFLLSPVTDSTRSPSTVDAGSNDHVIYLALIVVGNFVTRAWARRARAAV